MIGGSYSAGDWESPAELRDDWIIYILLKGLIFIFKKTCGYEKNALHSLDIKNYMMVTIMVLPMIMEIFIV